MRAEILANLVGLVVALLTAVNAVLLWSIRDMVKRHDTTLAAMRAELDLVRARTHQQLSHITEHQLRIGILEEESQR